MQVKSSDILAELETWYTSERGAYLLETTREAVQDTLDRAFGYHVLQLGVSGDVPLLQGSRINHQMYCAERTAPGIGVIAHPDELPLESDSIDTVIVHHCLEFARNPHGVLREIQRVLTPQGNILVVGFNPYSLMGVHTRVRGLLRNSLWQHHRPISQLRLTDWLHLLDCEVHETHYLYGLPPFGGGRWRQWMTRGDDWLARRNLPVGGLYVLHASKQVAGVHPLRKRRLSPGERLIDLVPASASAPRPIPPTSRTSKPVKKGSVAS